MLEKTIYSKLKNGLYFSLCCLFCSFSSLVCLGQDDLEPETTLNWGQRGPFFSVPRRAEDQFGSAVDSLGSDQFLVGIPLRKVRRDPPVLNQPLDIEEVGQVNIYSSNGSLTKVIPHPFSIEGNRFGSSVAHVGTDFFVVGAPHALRIQLGIGNTQNAGSVYVFKANGDLVKTILNPKPTPNSFFGSVLEGLGSDRILIGVSSDSNEGSEAGRVYIYDVSGDRIATLSSPSPNSGGRFGNAIAAVGSNRFVVCEYRDNTKGHHAGMAYLYDGDGNLIKEITADSVTTGDNFGRAVSSIGGGGFAIGSSHADVGITVTNSMGTTEVQSIRNAGEVHLFDQDGRVTQQLISPAPERQSLFGYTLSSVGDDRLLVASIGKTINGIRDAGGAFLFTLDGDLLSTISNPDPGVDEFFGVSLTRVGEDRFCVGVAGDDTHENNSGSVYIYHAPKETYELGMEIERPEIVPPAGGPTVEPPDAAFWHPLTERLYAVKPGNVFIVWPVFSPDEKTIVRTINKQALIVWPEDSVFQTHVERTPPVDLSPYSSVEIMYSEALVDSENLSINKQFDVSGTGRTLLMLSHGSPNEAPIFFQFVKTIAWDDPSYLVDNEPAEVGEEILDLTYHDLACGSPYVYWRKSRYMAETDYYNRADRTGPIIPVNLDNPNEPDDDMVIIYYEQGNKVLDQEGTLVASSVHWPYQPVRYQVTWPLEPEKIIIANLDSSTRKAVDTDRYVGWDLYFQNDPELPGFNPNDEHAVRRPWAEGEALFPLRDDLGSDETSLPYVIMSYRDGEDELRPKVKVYQVLAEEDPYFFNYTGDAGVLVQAPFPLSVFQKCPESSGVSGPYWRDRKLDFWARAAGDDGGDATIIMRYFYPVQDGFYFPATYYDGEEGPPTPGSHIPWLDLRPGNMRGIPQDIAYTIAWPDAPELRIGETLVKPKRGLPDISLQTSVEIIYQQSIALEGKESVKLIDPIIEHEVDLEELPSDATVLNVGGINYFPTLPPQLRARFRYDPLNQKLKFRGEFVEVVAGEEPYYLLLNVITDRENSLLLDLSIESEFRTALNALAKKAEQAIEVQPDAEAFESLALTAGLSDGTGYVSLAFGNNPDLNEEADPVSVEIIRVTCPLFKGDLKVIESDNPFDEKLTLRHAGDFAGLADEYEFEWRTLPPVDGLPSTQPQENWSLFVPQPASGVGAIDITIEGAGLFTLSDNYFICRYRRSVADPCGPEWSAWTSPMLAEGWIKRVLKSINPFEQRIKSYRDIEVNTVVSMISQAGQRWEGNVPLNNAGALEFGLIEIYETVLQRGTKLSIDGAPPVDYPPANDALLLAAGRLADLYMLLGNEAYADASDPTIAFGTDDGIYGSEATSIHCFMNQTDSLLEEELALLRGRDDRLLPSIRTSPIYNRLIWNFTGDINGGEVAYALNYNIEDENNDISGVIDEADAKELYPQGHGDAWGHYLTAIKNYYRLLRNPSFSWVPRIEAVLVGGVPVSVDFLDERKFARAAAARARTGREIVNLTYRERYMEDPKEQFQGYKDEDETRGWGLDEWGRRACQGALFDWVVGNAILPDKDRDPDHVGIQVVDRTTVSELREVAATLTEIQGEIDKSNLGLNPLGLAKNVIPFDIDPSAISQGKTHFEQVYERAVVAMNNSITVFNHANNSTQLLRRQADTVNEFQEVVEAKEIDFNNRLIEVFGYPYSDDIGPTGTYPSGYVGPDIYHYDYVDVTELLGLVSPPETQVISVDFKDYYKQIDFSGNDDSIAEETVTVQYNIAATRGLGSIKPEHWTGKRKAPGAIQNARSNLLQALARFQQGIQEYRALINQIRAQGELLETTYDVNAREIEILNESKTETEYLSEVILDKQAHIRDLEFQKRITEMTTQSGIDAIVKIVGLANDPFSALRAAVRVGGIVAVEVLNHAQRETTSSLEEKIAAKEIVSLAGNIKIAEIRNAEQARQQLEILEQLIRNEPQKQIEVNMLEEALRQASGEYLRIEETGLRLLSELERFRQQTASRIQSYRYKDMAFRIFRNDALQKYRAQFDLASRYVFLAAKAFDFETNLSEDDPRGPGQTFMKEIIRTRSLGLIQNGLPQTGSGQGDAGLADPLARMSSNWSLVLKGQLGFNNPQTETGRFSLRSELFRIKNGLDSQAKWRETLERHVVPNLLELEEFQRYCIPFQPQQDREPAVVIPFSSTVNFGLNLFGWPAGGGDNSYDSTQFATKIRSVGIWFANYNNLGGGLINTPRVYLIPIGTDIMRSPSSDNANRIREWKIVDQALPVPFRLSAGDLTDESWIPINDTLSDEFASIRKYSSFRAYHDGGVFDPNQTISASRLVGRSVWNTQWLLIIPAGTLHSDRGEGIQRFIHGRLLPSGERDGNGVFDIRIFFQTYAYSGN